MSQLHEVPEYVKFKVRDTVKVRPRVGKQYGGTVLRILADEEDRVVEVEIHQTTKFRSTKPVDMIRTALPDCVTKA